MVAVLLLVPGFGFGFCLPPEGGITPKEGGELSWLSFGMSKGEFASQRKGVPSSIPKLWVCEGRPSISRRPI